MKKRSVFFFLMALLYVNIMSLCCVVRTGDIKHRYKREHWGFRFYGFGHFWDRFFGFCTQNVRFFGFSIRFFFFKHPVFDFYRKKKAVFRFFFFSYAS